jgi:hypothetical protein
LVIGAVLRIGWAVAAPQEPAWDPVPSDPGWYLHIGDMVSNGDGYSYIVKTGPDDLDLEAQATAYYPPGYPLVLGGLFWATDLLPGDVSDLDAAVALNVVLSIVTIALVFELGRRVVNARVGLAAAAVMAFWPNLIFHTGVVLTETLFMFLLAAILLVTLASAPVARSPGAARLLTVGALFGLLGLVRPTSLVLGPLFLLFWLPAGARRALARTALVAAATFAVILPWTVRNWAQLGDPVAISTNTGDNVCIGYNPDATGAYGDPGNYCLGSEVEAGLGDDTRSLNTHDPVREERGEYEVRRQSETLDRARTSIESSPQRIFTLMPSRLGHTMWDDADGLEAAGDYGRQPLFKPATRGVLRGGANLFYVGAMAVAAAGAWLATKRWLSGNGDKAGRLWFLGAAALVQLVPPLITFGDSRFKMPIYPTVAVFAGVALVVLIWAAGVLRKLLRHVLTTGVHRGRGAGAVSDLSKLLVRALESGALSGWQRELGPDEGPAPASPSVPDATSRSNGGNPGSDTPEVDAEPAVVGASIDAGDGDGGDDDTGDGSPAQPES